MGRNIHFILIRRYLDIRGITPGDIEEATGLKYHTIYSTLIGRSAGRKVREAIATYLDIPFESLWGVSASRYLRSIIKEEIDRQVDCQRRRMSLQYLSDTSNTLANTKVASNV